jgi:hypothetical protein
MSALFAYISCAQHDKVIKCICIVAPVTTTQITTHDWIFQKKIP